MSYGSYPPGAPAPAPAAPPPPSRLGGIAIVIAVLAVVVVLGIVAGVVVWTINGSANPDPGATGSPSAGSASGGDSTPPQLPTGSPGPPVGAANLPTSGDLVWPAPLAWKVETTTEGPQAAVTAPCQTWRPTGEPPETAVQVRTYSLQKADSGAGSAIAYVISYASEADAERAAESVISDGMSCGERIQGRQGPRMELDLPLGHGVFTDVVWTDNGTTAVGAWGVARHGSRLVWLWAQVPGDGSPWAGHSDGHPMAASLARALGRLNY